MKVKLFGKNLFEFQTSRGEYLIGNSRNHLKDSPYLPDFNRLGNRDNSLSEFVVIEDSLTGKAKAIPVEKNNTKKIELTPKAVFEMKMLNDDSIKIKTGKEYIEKQVELFTDKLNLLKTSEYDMENGVIEISSILIRLENRKKYKDFKKFFDNYAYSTIAKVNDLTEKHSYLKLGKVEQFVADLPKEAVNEMKEYEKKTKELCDKKPIFYIIANKKDFVKSDKRRDPILLAQSPFGHLWQILGAWDEEMLLLDEL